MSAGPTAGLFKNFIMVGILCIVFGQLFDLLILSTNTFQLSGDALNTLGYLSMMLKAFPVLYLIALVLNHIVESNNESSRGV